MPCPYLPGPEPTSYRVFFPCSVSLAHVFSAVGSPNDIRVLQHSSLYTMYPRHGPSRWAVRSSPGLRVVCCRVDEFKHGVNATFAM